MYISYISEIDIMMPFGNLFMERPPHTVQMGSQTVEPVTKFTYRGSDIDSNGYSIVEIHQRLDLVNCIMGQLDGVWKQQKLSLTIKLPLCSSLILSVQVWNLSYEKGG